MHSHPNPSHSNTPPHPSPTNNAHSAAHAPGPIRCTSQLPLQQRVHKPCMALPSLLMAYPNPPSFHHHHQPTLISHTVLLVHQGPNCASPSCPYCSRQCQNPYSPAPARASHEAPSTTTDTPHSPCCVPAGTPMYSVAAHYVTSGEHMNQRVCAYEAASPRRHPPPGGTDAM